MALVLAGQQNAAPCGSLKFLSRHAGTGCDLGGVEIAGLVNQVLCSCSVGLVVFWFCYFTAQKIAMQPLLVLDTDISTVLRAVWDELPVRNVSGIMGSFLLLFRFHTAC